MTAGEEPRSAPNTGSLGLIRRAGYTFVEILLAGAIAAITLAVATAALFALVRHLKPAGGYVTIILGSPFANNFYGINTANIEAPIAPSYSSSAMAEMMREQLETDIASSSAVFVLARNERNTLRPLVISNLSDGIARGLGTPESFRQFIDPSGSVYGSYAGPATNYDCCTMYCLSASTNSGQADVRAIYESDVLRVASPPGYYASVRRYVGSAYSDFYHVFYADDAATGGDTNSFHPMVVHFDRQAATNGDASMDRYRVASNRPFYFVWWPDPATPKLDYTNGIPSPTPATNSPRRAYHSMAGRTSLFMVVPAFPAQ